MTERFWFICGKVYNLAPFLSHHPGGAEALLAVRGQECTQVFIDNHPYTNPGELLAPYEVGGRLWMCGRGSGNCV